MLLVHKEEATYCFLLYLREKLIKNNLSPYFLYETRLSNTSSTALKSFEFPYFPLLHPNNSKVKSTLEGACWRVKCESADEGSRLRKFHSPAQLQLAVLSPTSNVHANVLAYIHVHKILPLAQIFALATRASWWRQNCQMSQIPSFPKNDNIHKTTPKWPLTSPCSLLGSFIWKWCYKKSVLLDRMPDKLDFSGFHFFQGSKPISKTTKS